MCQQTKSFSAHRPEHAVTRPSDQSDQSDQSALLANDSSTLTLFLRHTHELWKDVYRLKLSWCLKSNGSLPALVLSCTNFCVSSPEDLNISSAVMRLMCSFSLSQQPRSLVLFLHLLLLWADAGVAVKHHWLTSLFHLCSHQIWEHVCFAARPRSASLRRCRWGSD